MFGKPNSRVAEYCSKIAKEGHKADVIEATVFTYEAERLIPHLAYKEIHREVQMNDDKGKSWMSNYSDNMGNYHRLLHRLKCYRRIKNQDLEQLTIETLQTHNVFISKEHTYYSNKDIYE